MNWKKYFAACAAVAALVSVSPVVYAAEEQPAAEEQQAGGRDVSPEEALQLYKQNGYKYASDRYGYTMVLPVKPKGVLPLSTIENGSKGELLIFDNVEYNIKYAWVVRLNAFDESMIPVDLIKKSEAEQKKQIEIIMKACPFEDVKVTDINGVSGIYGVTAKEIEVDTNGDGKMDDKMVSDTQEIHTYFRGKLGGRFSVDLIDNPNITSEHVAIYQLGLLTFEEIPAIKMKPAAKK